MLLAIVCIGAVAASWVILRDRRSSTSSPPPIILRTAHDDEQHAAVGSSCWSGEYQMVCGDGPPVIPAAAITIQAGDSAHLDFSRLGAPTDVGYQIYPYDRFKIGSVPGSRNTIASHGDLGRPLRSGKLSPATHLALQLDVPPGEYVLLVFSDHWQGQTAQGFHIVVD